MIKTVLATTIIALGMSAGTAFAQERTFSAWGHDFTTVDAAPQTSLEAQAPRSTMQTRAVDVEGHKANRASSAQ